MIKFLKFFQIVSIIFFLPVIIGVYAYLPTQVALNMEREGLPGMIVSKEVFFYSLLVLFAVSNMLCITLGKALQQLPARSSASGAAVFFNTASKHDLISWLKGFNIIINAFFIFGSIYIGMLNNDEAMQGKSYDFIFYIGPTLMVVWLLVFIVIIFRRPNNSDYEIQP